jgi:hypothetical protein
LSQQHCDVRIHKGARISSLRRQGRTLMIRRVVASKFAKRRPSDEGRPSPPPARRTASRRGHRVAGSRSPSLGYRSELRAWARPPQSAHRVLDSAAKQWEPAWEVVDDFPEDIAVLPREVRVIETYLARLLDESLEAATLGTDTPATEAAKEDGE